MQKVEMWKVIVLGLVGVVIGKVLMAVIKGTFLETIALWLIGMVVLGFIGYLFWLFLVKNKSVLKASESEKAEALLFKADPAMGVIYLFRKTYMGLLVGMDVVLDGNLIGQTRGYCFYRLLVSPGAHVLTGEKKCEEPLQLQIAAGQVIYVEKEILMGAMKGGYRYKVNENIAKAQELIRGCKLLLPAIK